MTEREVKKILRDLSDGCAITYNYFGEFERMRGEDTSGEKVAYTKEPFYNKFGDLPLHFVNIHVVKTGYPEHVEQTEKFISRKLFKWSVLMRTFSQLENEVKEKLLGNFATLLGEINEKAEENKKAEIDQLCIGKDEQIRTLEERLKILQEKVDSSEKQIRILESDNEQMKNCFLIDKEECSENFEFVEASHLLKSLNINTW